MGEHLVNTGEYGGISEYYESCRECIRKYFCGLKEFGADMRFGAYPLLLFTKRFLFLAVTLVNSNIFIWTVRKNKSINILTKVT